MSSSFQDPPGPDQQPGQPSASQPGYYSPPPGQGYPPQEYQYASGPAVSPAGGPPREALAGFWQRFGGAVLDAIILGIVAAIIGSLTGVLDFGDVGSAQSVQAIVGGNLITLLLGAAYFTYFHGSGAGQTLGNRVAGVRVLDAASGGTLPYARAFIRFLVTALGTIVTLISPGVGGAVGLLVLVGYLWMLWDPRKQTWHDKAANSLVVKAAAYPAR